MIYRIQQVIRLFALFREHESAQRNFLHALYGAPAIVPNNYARPAYLRREKLVRAR